MKYNKQVDKKHYKYGKYLHVDRWVSYFHQLENIFYISNFMRKKAEDIGVLEIGLGDGTISSLLKHYRYNIMTMDVALDLKPDIVAALPDVPIKKAVDIIICCEVLEHIHYSDAEKSLKNMAKKTKYAVISVPHKSLYLSFFTRVPLLKPFKFLFELPTPFIKHNFDGQHYWELGTRGYSVNRFKQSIIKAGFDCMNDFRVTEFPYHHFFILRKK